MAEQDDPVSRRQFFRGLGGELFKAIGELTGLDAEPDPPPMKSWNEADGVPFVPPEEQAAKLSEIFGFLEQLGAESREEGPELPTEPDPPPRLQ